MYLTIQDKKQKYLQKIHSRIMRHNDMIFELLSWFLIIMNVIFMILNSYLMYYSS